MTEDPESTQGIEAISYTPSPSTGYGDHQLGWSHQVIHSNSAQNNTEVNLDKSTLDSTSGEKHDVHSHSYRQIPEYTNLRTSELRQIKIIQDKDKRKKGIPEVFGLIYLLAYVAMSATNYILP